jgi:hypothetical protein
VKIGKRLIDKQRNATPKHLKICTSTHGKKLHTCTIYCEEWQAKYSKLYMDRIALAEAIFDIDSHSTSVNTLHEDDWVEGFYITTIGSVHRAIGLLGGPLPKASNAPRPVACEHGGGYAEVFRNIDGRWVWESQCAICFHSDESGVPAQEPPNDLETVNSNLRRQIELARGAAPQVEPASVLQEIAKERQHQDEKWGAEHDDHHNGEEWCNLILPRIGRSYKVSVEERRRALVEATSIAAVASEESGVKPADLRKRKVHLVGPMTSGGFFRTLCEHNISATMNATADKESVTCAICVWRMQRIDQGMEPA